MKNLLRPAFVLLICMASLTSFAQSNSWMLFNGSQAFTAQDIVQLPDGSVVLAGSSLSTLDTTWYYYPSTFTIARVTKEGDVLWAKKMDDLGGGYYGSFSTLYYSNNALFVGFTSYDTLTYEYFEGMMKLDLNGNQLACKVSPQSYFSYSRNRYAQLPNGNIVMLRSVVISMWHGLAASILIQWVIKTRD
jgi:hypothetical protein